MEEEVWETEIKKTKERVVALEDRIREGERSSETEKENREAHVRIDELGKDRGINLNQLSWLPKIYAPSLLLPPPSLSSLLLLLLVTPLQNPCSWKVQL